MCSNLFAMLMPHFCYCYFFIVTFSFLDLVGFLGYPLSGKISEFVVEKNTTWSITKTNGETIIIIDFELRAAFARRRKIKLFPKAVGGMAKRSFPPAKFTREVLCSFLSSFMYGTPPRHSFRVVDIVKCSQAPPPHLSPLPTRFFALVFLYLHFPFHFPSYLGAWNRLSGTWHKALLTSG